MVYINSFSFIIFFLMKLVKMGKFLKRSLNISDTDKTNQYGKKDSEERMRFAIIAKIRQRKITHDLKT